MTRDALATVQSATSLATVSTELTRRRAVDLLRVATALCRPS
jgi:hypothetical protein